MAAMLMGDLVVNGEDCTWMPIKIIKDKNNYDYLVDCYNLSKQCPLKLFSVNISFLTRMPQIFQRYIQHCSCQWNFMTQFYVYHNMKTVAVPCMLANSICMGLNLGNCLI